MTKRRMVLYACYVVAGVEGFLASSLKDCILLSIAVMIGMIAQEVDP